MPGRRGTPEERFWRHVDKEGSIPPLHPELDNCWLWTGAKIPKGYGLFWVIANKQQIYAHRFVFNEIPSRLVINHLCEVPSCVRRTHLEIVTYSENSLYSIRTKPRPKCIDGCTCRRHFPKPRAYTYPSPMLGRNHSQETRKKMSESHIATNALKTPEERLVWHTGKKR